MKKVLVIGSNGFIGQNICKKLIADEYTVFSADLAESSKHKFQHLYTSFNVINDNFDSVINDVDCVVYLVSTLLPQPSNQNIIRDINENLTPVIRLLEAIRNSGRLTKVIFSSSGGTIYGVHEEKITEESFLDPKCSYGIMKLAVEKYLHLYSDLYGIKTISLRLSNPYGSGQDFNRPQGAIGVFLHKMVDNSPIEIWGDGSVVRDYIFIEDVAAAFSAAVEYTGQSDVFNIGMGTGTSLNELLDILFKLTGSSSAVNYTESRIVDVPSNILDISRAKEYLGWSPVFSLRDGLEKLVPLISNEN